MKNITNRQRAKAALIFAFVFMGAYALAYNMFNTLLPTIKEFYGMSVTEASSLSVAESIGQISIMFLSALFVDKTDKNIVLGIAVILYGLTFILMGSVPAIFLFLILRVICGMMASFVSSVSSSYVADVFGEERNKYIPMLHTLYAVGAIVGPKFAAMNLKAHPEMSGWGSAYLMIGYITIAAGIIYFVVFAFIKKPQLSIQDRSKSERVSILSLFKNRNVWALCLSNMFMNSFYYFTNWLQTYLSTSDPKVYTTSIYSNIMMFYAIGQLIGLSLSGFLASKLGSARCERILAIGSVILSFIGLTVNTPLVWSICMFLIGFLVGPFYTYGSLIAFAEYPQATATISSIMTVFSGVGIFVATPIMGMIADNFAYKTAMYLASSMILFVFIMYTLVYKEKKPNEQ